jgi:hypothetical protein
MCFEFKEALEELEEINEEVQLKHIVEEVKLNISLRRRDSINR